LNRIDFGRLRITNRRCTVLKKAGIVVATAAAGLLAVSPLAFAGDKGDHHEGSEQSRGHEQVEVEGVNNAGDTNEGLINLSENNVAVPVNVCDNQVPVNVLGVQVPVNDVEVLADLSGALGLGLLGDAEAANEEEDADTTLDDSCKAAAEQGDAVMQSNED
jgi:hypothetical protein